MLSFNLDSVFLEVGGPALAIGLVLGALATWLILRRRQRDLEARVLRHVSPAFVEDPLRVLRVARFAARFAALGFTVAPETQELMRAIVASGEMGALVPERVWVETERALGEESPVTYCEVLRACGALRAKPLPPTARAALQSALRATVTHSHATR